MKVCKGCKRKLQEKSFVAKGHGKRAAICYKCKYERKSKEYKRRKNCRAQGYTLSIEDYHELKIKQNNCCAICKKNTKLVVDHDHENGNVRGLLCHNCNIGLGMMKDSPDILRAASLYLLRDSK